MNRKDGVAADVLNAEAEHVASGAKAGSGLRVTPRRGSACVFYTCDAAGRVDGDAFHFGQTLHAHGSGKFTLQFFKERPREARTPKRRVQHARKVHPTGEICR